ncbi:MAG: hypothetical protein PWQ79_621 [Thermococcaceae archaeon]|nr:hypothetical protein [Thermococcaceae archaeon]MDK2913706.1 hypothetical protein [Thermococcaceae archaeon]
MARAQVSIDFLFAVVLVMLTVLNLVYIATGERAQAEEFDLLAKLKVFTVDVRDTTVKVYSVGDGFRVRKELPIELKPGEWVVVALNSKTDKVVVTAKIGGKSYKTEQKLSVPIYEDSSVNLTSGNSVFWIEAEYDKTGGKTNVTLSP